MREENRHLCSVSETILILWRPYLYFDLYLICVFVWTEQCKSHCQNLLSALSPRGYSTYVWVGSCRPDLETLTLFFKKFVKIMENWYPVYDFQIKFHSFFRQNAWLLDPVYKKSSKIFDFETLFISGRSKNHTLKGGTSPYGLCMGVPHRDVNEFAFKYQEFMRATRHQRFREKNWGSFSEMDKIL